MNKPELVLNYLSNSSQFGSYRHFNNDPRRDPSLIRCLQYHDDKSTTPVIVSSVRIFQRTISIGNGRTLEAGGIGEVCTSEDHRRRGLAKRLLQDAIDTMVNDGKMKCSLLHASAALQLVYEKSGGYRCVNSKWSVIKLDLECLNSLTEDECLFVRRASFPNDTQRLQEIHKSYSEDRFAGCIIRTTEYWNEYLRNEIGDTLFVLTDPAECVIAWLSIRPRNGRYQICDFGVDIDLCESMNFTTAQILSRLLKASLAGDSVLENQKIRNVDLHLPTVVVDEMKNQQDFCRESCNWVDWSVKIKDDNDTGWMYKIFSDNECFDVEHVVSKMDVPHLIWPSDSF